MALWGREGLRRCPARALRDVAIPDTSKWFLTEYSLPAFWGGYAFFVGIDDSLPRLSLDLPHYRLLHSPPPSLTGLTFCLDEQRSGAVVYASPRADVEESPVNTSVELFAAHWVLHRKLLTEAAALSIKALERVDLLPVGSPAWEHEWEVYKKAVDPILDRTEREMRRLDPLVWEGLTAPRDNFYGEDYCGNRYWPDMLSEYAVYAMWDAEDVLARWTEPPRVPS
ncbi:MAG: SUKH-4 family immunity protein [Armatimonadota bacterium]|nr:SUKH-4 family immunity protein [Armatimonadota bacterium]